MFDKFDHNDDGEIDYEELMLAVTKELSPIRKDLVAKAFRKLDIDESGTIEVNDIKSLYNAKLHPDVKSGKKSEDEVLAEFLDTFEAH